MAITRCRTALFVPLLVVGLLPGKARGGEDLSPEPQLRLEIGRHLGPVRALSADGAGRILLSGGDDKTVRLWDASSGALLHTLRPPSEAGAEGIVTAAALSPDGRRVALCILAPSEGSDRPAVLLVFDRAGARMLRRVTLPGDVLRAVFAPDGSRLALALGRGGLQVLSVPGLAQQRLAGATLAAHGVDFDAKGRLVVANLFGQVRLYDSALQLLAEAQLDETLEPLSVRFSPDGQKIAIGYGSAPRVDVRAGDDLRPLFQPDCTGVTAGLGRVAWSLDGQTLYAGGTYAHAGAGLVRVFSAQGRGPHREGGCGSGAVRDLSAVSSGVACAGDDGSIALFGPDGRLLRPLPPAPLRLGPIDLLVEATAERLRLLLRGGPALSFSLPDRALVEGGPSDTSALFPPRTSDPTLPLRDWQDRADVRLGTEPLLPPAMVHGGLATEQISRSVAVAKDGFLLGTTWDLFFFNRMGVRRWSQPLSQGAQAVNLSGDGRLALAVLEDGGVRWHRSADGQLLLTLFIHPDRRRWIALTPSGAYDASAGGEAFVGWHVNRGPSELGDFFPSAVFRDRFYRPDVIGRLLRLLDEDKARAEADAVAGRRAQPAALRAELPPVLSVLSPEDGAGLRETQVAVRVSVRSEGGAPLALRALVDGRTVARTQLPQGVAGEQIHNVTVPVPARDSTLTLIVEAPRSSSEPRSLRLRFVGKAAAAPELKPKLYVLSVGISAYRQKDLVLSYPAKDARDMAAALKEQEGRLYRGVEVRLLLDGAARRDGILSGLEWLRRQVTDKDVAVLFLAGHGFNDPGTGEYYYLPHDGDPQELLRSMVPGALLRSALSGLSGKALLLLDTCFAGQVFPGRSFRGSADTTRFVNELASAGSGVVVMAAASGRQVAQESRAWQNGAFTKALIEGLRGRADYGKTGRITLNMIDLYVSERVKELTRGLQTPTSARPATIADFPLAVLP